MRNLQELQCVHVNTKTCFKSFNLNVNLQLPTKQKENGGKENKLHLP